MDFHGGRLIFNRANIGVYRTTFRNFVENS